MTYRVFYKRILRTTDKMALVEDDVVAADFAVVDGHLIFYKEVEVKGQDFPEHVPFMAIPPTFWALVEPADSSRSESLIT